MRLADRFTLTAPFLAASLALAGCAELPDLGPREPLATAGWPKLEPVGGLLAQADEVTISDESVAGLLGRGAALRARAARLRLQTVGG